MENKYPNAILYATTLSKNKRRLERIDWLLYGDGDVSKHWNETKHGVTYTYAIVGE